MLNPTEVEETVKLLESLGFEVHQPKPASIRVKIGMPETKSEPAIPLPDLTKYEKGTVFYFTLSNRTTAFILGDKRHFVLNGPVSDLEQHGFVSLVA